MRVMVVEDDVQLRQVVGLFLRSSGVQVVAETSDGAEALDLLARIDVDVILTDLQMPRMDGIALVRQLRSRGDKTPVIMMSGRADPDLLAAARTAGVSYYLAKPVSAESLSSAFDKAFPKRAA